MSDIIRLRVASLIIPGAVDFTDTTVCHGSSVVLRAEPSTGGSSKLVYQWQQLCDDGITWADVTEGTGGDTTVYTTPALTATTTYRLRTTGGLSSCETTYGDEITVRVLPQSILNYPDLSIRACPGAPGSTISLLKYIDTVAVTNIVWNSAPGAPAIVASTGVISADKLVVRSTYTYTYTVTNPCVSDMTRKIYLKVLNDDRLKMSKDTIEICYETADAVQINQIFGIEAGGTLDGGFSPDGDISSHVTISAAYGGAVIMNGRGIYDDPTIGFFGATDTKRVVFTYTSDPDSCLNGKTYTIVIILYKL
jgi:hypothetical protein